MRISTLFIALLLTTYSFAQRTEAKQDITSGTETTIENNVVFVKVNPSSVLASHTINLPVSPYDRQEILILFGGTITSGSVVTSLTIAASQGIIQTNAPTTANAGEGLLYVYDVYVNKYFRSRPIPSLPDQQNLDAANITSGVLANARVQQSNVTQHESALSIGQNQVSNLITDLGNKQAADADLTTIAGLTATTDNFIVGVASAWASRTVAQVKTTLAINNVDNTSDANKPVSTATQTALNLKANITSASLVTPNIGAATGTSLTTTGEVKSSGTAGIGYATGAGGTVTQATSKSTGVTLNKTSGQITMNGAALAAAAEVAFTLTNSTIAATDVVYVCIQSVGTAGSYFVTVGAVANGSCSITVGNTSAASLSQAIVLNFVVIKGVNN